MVKSSTVVVVGRSMDTKHDVEALMRKFEHDLKPGFVIPYKEISLLIGEAKHSKRWISVIRKFKEALFSNRNMLIKADINQGYLVLSNSQRITESGSLIHHGMRRVVKAGVIANRTSTKGLTVEEINTREHHSSIVASITAHLALREKTAKKLA